MADAFICDAVRTPIGRYGGALAKVRTDDLAAVPLKALLARNPEIASAIDEIVFGCANQAGEDNRNVARMAALLSGLPDTTPAMTVNRLCASGLDAVGAAARAIKAGEIDLAIAGGEREVALAGGADAPLDPFDLGCLATRRAPAGGPPFTVAEGAAVWVLEERGHARRRGARELGEIRGYSSTAAVGGDVPAAIRRALSSALAGAGDLADEPASARVESAARQTAALSRELHHRLGHALAASGPIDGALRLAGMAEASTAASAAAGLVLAIGTLGQCAALALAGPECS